MYILLAWKLLSSKQLWEQSTELMFIQIVQNTYAPIIKHLKR